MPQIHDDVWLDYDTGGHIPKKIEIVKKWIPQDVHNIIDIGCGNGIICNALARDYDVTGIDISETALKAVVCNKIQCSATEIPVPDQSFDLVFSSEMLEHLSSEDLQIAVSEMKRISRRHILISVPNQEQLAATMVKCASCKTTYHAYGHLHCFTRDVLASYFPEYKVKRTLRFGPMNRDYISWLLWIKNTLGGQYYHPVTPVLCPTCNGSSYIKKSNLISKTCNLLNQILSKPKPYWLMLLLEK